MPYAQRNIPFILNKYVYSPVSLDSIRGLSINTLNVFGKQHEYHVNLLEFSSNFLYAGFSF